MRLAVKIKKTVIGIGFCSSVAFLGILCRGHVPDRSETTNLPSWQRVLPRPAEMAVKPKATPADYLAITESPQSPVTMLFHNTNNIESLISARQSGGCNPKALEVIASWLVDSCSGCYVTPQRLRLQRDIAFKILSLQGGDGWFMEHMTSATVTSQALQAQGDVVNALCVYFAATRNPASYYAALLGSESILQYCNNASYFAGVKASPDLVEPLSRLYVLTRDYQYLKDAKQLCQSTANNGVGLALLYEITGDKIYLQSAICVFSTTLDEKRTNARLGYELFKILDDCHYRNCITEDCPENIWAAAAGAALVGSDLQLSAYSDNTMSLKGLTIGLWTINGTTTAKILATTGKTAERTLRIYVPSVTGVSTRDVASIVEFNNIIAEYRKPINQLKFRGTWKTGDTIIVKQSSGSSSTIQNKAT